MELDDIPAVGQTERADDEVIANNVVKETETAEDEKRLDMEKEFLWEGIKGKIKPGKGNMDFGRRWKYGEEREFSLVHDPMLPQYICISQINFPEHLYD